MSRKLNGGLENGQSTSANKIHDQINSSLTAVSMAEAVIRQRQSNDEETVLSIKDIKTEIHNKLLTELIFSIYGIGRELI